MKDSCLVRKETISLPHEDDAIDFSLPSHTADHVFHVLESLDKGEKWGIRLEEGGPNSFGLIEEVIVRSPCWENFQTL